MGSGELTKELQDIIAKYLANFQGECEGLPPLVGVDLPIPVRQPSEVAEDSPDDTLPT